jgi:hypothetical protein
MVNVRVGTKMVIYRGGISFRWRCVLQHATRHTVSVPGRSTEPTGISTVSLDANTINTVNFVVL